MPLPLIPVIAALAAGGSMVPHAAGGMIVTMGASGYVAGTYLSTAAIASLVGAASVALGSGSLALAGVASTIIGSAGIFGTTIGATGLTGVLMSVGILPATPVAVPIAIGGAAVGTAYLSYVLVRLRRKLRGNSDGEEIQFTPTEAKIVGALVKRLAAKNENTPAG
jgi:hypothetical protein